MSIFFLVAFGVWLAGGIAAALAAGKSTHAIGVGAAIVGCVLGLIPALVSLLSQTTISFPVFPWSLPLARFSLELDPLSAFFILPILGLAGAAALYGAEYLRDAATGRRAGLAWLAYNLLVASMAAVVLARNAVLFLLAWEVMSLASFALVMFHHKRPEIRQAGWTYLVATHLGTFFLLVFFLILGCEMKSMEFGVWSRFTPSLAGPLFVLAVIGFGTKAGFLPLHVWLPEAHPAAPSHVSAVLSGVMIKTGIYGLVRAFTFLGPPPAWWGWILVAVGVTSGILGVVFALAQHDLKRLLAYHSVENIGIIALGLGLGLVGAACGSPTVAALGFAGGLLHVLNHALFKGLLFLAGGSVIHATSESNLDRLSGLLKRMPWTGTAFLIGAAAISGLPPLNGFVSEFLVYASAFTAILDRTEIAVPALMVAAGLALIGGLAAACFAKAFGCVFLGEPRSTACAHAHDPRLGMRLPMALLAGACAILGLGAPLGMFLVQPALASLPGLSAELAQACLAEWRWPLWAVALGSVALLGLVAAVAGFRYYLLAGRTLGDACTWDCGYAAPDVRMQYTASSFAQPLIRLFQRVLRTHVEMTSVAGVLPSAVSFSTHTPDLFKDAGFAWLFRTVDRGLSLVRLLQHGRLHLYILYLALVLAALLFWKLG